MDTKLPREDYNTIMAKFYRAFHDEHPATFFEGEIRQSMPIRKYDSLIFELRADKFDGDKAAALLATAAIPNLDYILLVRVEKLIVRQFKQPGKSNKPDSELQYCSDHILDLSFHLYNASSKAIDISGTAGNSRQICLDGDGQSGLVTDRLHEGKISYRLSFEDRDGRYPHEVPIDVLLAQLTLDIRTTILAR